MSNFKRLGCCLLGLERAVYVNTYGNMKKRFHLQSLEQVVMEDVSIKKHGGYNQLSAMCSDSWRLTI